MARTIRYWDGAKWTDNISPVAPAMPASAGASDQLIGVGWVMTLLLPLVGLIIGIVVTSKGSVNHGVGMIVGSVVISTIWLMVNGYA